MLIADLPVSRFRSNFLASFGLSVCLVLLDNLPALPIGRQAAGRRAGR